MIENAKEVTYELVELFGDEDNLVLFTNARIDPKSVPSSLYQYDVRHDDDNQGIPCEIKEYVLVNHWGTIITKTPIELDEHGSRDLRIIEGEDEESTEWLDWNYTGAPCSLEEFMMCN